MSESNSNPISQCRRLFLTSKIMEYLQSCPESLSDQKMEKLWNTAKAIEEGIYQTTEDNRQQYYHMIKAVVPSLKPYGENDPATYSFPRAFELNNPIKRLNAGVQKMVFESKEDNYLTEGSSPPKRVCTAATSMLDNDSQKSDSSQSFYSTSSSRRSSSPDFDVISRESLTPVPTESEEGEFDLLDDKSSNPKSIQDIWEEVGGTTPQISAPSSVAFIGFSDLKIQEKCCLDNKAILIGPVLPVTNIGLGKVTKVVENLCSSFQKHTKNELYKELKPVWEKIRAFHTEQPFRSANYHKENIQINKILNNVYADVYRDPWEFCEDVWKFFENMKSYHRQFSEESTAYLWCNEMAEMFTTEIQKVMQRLGYCCAQKRTKKLKCCAENDCMISFEEVYCSLVFENDTEEASESYTYCKKHFEKLTPQEIGLLEKKHQEQLRDEAIPKDIHFHELPVDEQYAMSRFQLLLHSIENSNEPLKSCKVCDRRWHVCCATNATKQVFICNNCWNTTKKVFNDWTYVTRLLLTGDFTHRHKTDPPLNCISLLSSLVKDSLSLQLFEEIVQEMHSFPSNLYALFESGRRVPYTPPPFASTDTTKPSASKTFKF